MSRRQPKQIPTVTREELFAQNEERAKKLLLDPEAIDRATQVLRHVIGAEPDEPVVLFGRRDSAWLLYHGETRKGRLFDVSDDDETALVWGSFNNKTRRQKINTSKIQSGPDLDELCTILGDHAKTYKASWIVAAELIREGYVLLPRERMLRFPIDQRHLAPGIDRPLQ